jgi:hypothetical protein
MILFFVIPFSLTVFGQVMPEAFLGMTPKIPANACLKDIDAIQEYENQIESILESIENEKERRNEDNEADSDENEKKALKKMAQQFGLSEEEIEKLQEENLSDEESEELVDKALQNSNNMSLGEVKNMDKLNSDGQKAWAESLGTEKMAEAQLNENKNWDKQIRTKSLYELTTLQKHLLDSIAAIESKFKQQIAEIDRDSEAKVMLNNIQEWESRAMELMGSNNSAEATSLNEKINAEKEKYCSKYSTQYLDILERYETYTKSCLTTCYKMESISARQAELQTGVEMNPEPGLLGIKKVADYLGLLRGAYKYNLFQNQ